MPALSPRKTKIVCTLGPATSSRQRIGELIEAGMNVVRLNFSHGDREEHRATIRRIREVSAELGREVGILQDLCGPKIRLGELAQHEIHLQPGQQVLLAPEPTDQDEAIPVGYPYLLDDVTEGDRILLADGLVELKVVGREAAALRCQVLVGDTVASHKGVNLPGSALRVPAFTDKDRLDLEVGLEEGVDFVALSFVRHERDLEPVAEVLARASQRPLLIAKIEKPEAVERLDQILPAVDGVMVARGDLGVEMPVEQVPMIQKRVIREARRAARPVITATQMLRSMVSSPRPLRAETTDVANAILDGTDAVMLSEETAIGRYPVRAVRMLDRIARSVEPAFDTTAWLDEPESPLLPITAAAISRAACVLADDIGASAVLASTTSGSTARLVSRYRPRATVVGFTPRQSTLRQLNLSWGVVPARAELYPDTDTMFRLALAWAEEHGLATAGGRLVLTAGLPINQEGTTNLLRVIDVESP
jgi:pyruvate kinase